MKLLAQILKLLTMACWLALSLVCSAQYELDWATVDAGVRINSGSPYLLWASAGQPVTGNSDSTWYHVELGFWSAFDDEEPASSLLPDLVVSAVVSSNVVSEGEWLLLSLVVSNVGNASASSVQLVLDIPAGAAIQTFANDSGDCRVSSNHLTCSMAGLAPHESFSMDASFILDTSAHIFDEIEDFEMNFLSRITLAESDVNLSNNVAAIMVRGYCDLDFGDARAPYPVSRADNGARHRDGSIYHLGARFDRENDCVNSALANADDLSGLPDDEDGVTIPSALLAGGTYNVMINVPVAGFLDAFFDFNNDGDWADAAERVTPVGGVPIGPGSASVAVTVPITAVAGNSCARFRFSDIGGLGPTGFYPVGEVQDEAVTIVLPPRINVTRSGRGMQLTWSEPGAILEESPSMTGPWTTVAGAASPYIVVIGSEPMKLYRLRLPTHP